MPNLKICINNNTMKIKIENNEKIFLIPEDNYDYFKLGQIVLNLKKYTINTYPTSNNVNELDLCISKDDLLQILMDFKNPKVE